MFFDEKTRKNALFAKKYLFHHTTIRLVQKNEKNAVFRIFLSKTVKEKWGRSPRHCQEKNSFKSTRPLPGFFIFLGVAFNRNSTVRIECHNLDQKRACRFLNAWPFILYFLLKF